MKSLNKKVLWVAFESFSKKIKQWKHYLPIINLFLFTSVVSLAILCVFLVYHPPEINKIPDKEEGGMPVKNNQLPSLRSDTRPINNYELILSNNPFSPNRTVWTPFDTKTEVKAEQRQVVEGVGQSLENQQKPRGIPKKIILRGIVILGNKKKALIENPDLTTSKKPFVFVEEGEEIAEYKVKTIEPDQVKLDWYGEEQVVVMRSNIKK